MEKLGVSQVSKLDSTRESLSSETSDSVTPHQSQVQSLVSKIKNAMMALPQDLSDTMDLNSRSTCQTDVSFEEHVEKELRSMAANLHQLDGLHPKDYPISFITKETTIDSIKGVCSLLDCLDDGVSLFDVITLPEFFKVFSIMGTPVNAFLNKDEDPYKYLVKTVFPGSYCSVADILVAEAGQTKLHVPGIFQSYSSEITNIVPDLSCEKLRNFLTTFAPKTLSYVSSLGMRRTIVDIQGTFDATFVTAILRLMSAMRSNENSRDLAMALVSFCLVASNLTEESNFTDFPNATCSQKSSVYDFASKNLDMRRLFTQYLRLMRKRGESAIEDPVLINHLKKIQRSFFVAEVCRTFSKMKASRPDPKTALYELLDIKTSKLPWLTPLYHKDVTWKQTGVKIPFTMNPDVRDKYLTYLRPCQIIGFFESILLPIFQGKIFELQPLYLSQATFSDGMGLSADLDPQMYQYLVLVQYFLKLSKKAYTPGRRALRFDVARFNTPLHKNHIANTIQRYVDEQYKSLYQGTLNHKKSEELRILEDNFLRQLFRASEEETEKILIYGITVTSYKYIVSKPSHKSFSKVCAMLCDEKKFVDDRMQKIEMLVLGVNSSGTPVFNNGRPIDDTFIAEIGMKASLIDACGWGTIVERHKQSQKAHKYRELRENRHGHSNQKCSFWALGFPTITKMKSSLSEEAWQEYRHNHADCCGLVEK